MGGLEEEKHARYIVSVEKKKDDFEALLIEHLRMNGAYWGLTTLDLLNKIGAIDVDEVVVISGGFAGNLGHDPHLLYTLSAVQVLAIVDRIDVLDIGKVSDCILLMWLAYRTMMDLFLVICGVKLTLGMVSLLTRYISFKSLQVCYSWWVLSSLIMIDRVHWIDKEKLTRFILNCQAVFIISTGLSLMEYPGLKSIDPAYALPVDVVNRIFFRK
ncbi:hypothetical protein GW17_00008619 [Ensete ventricosum]|nr:hypothetical protein GW17_00008619 [Ensete ventricosum]